MKIAFITAIYGSYEATAKRPAAQSIACDFHLFTDDAAIPAVQPWRVDITPWHRELPVEEGLHNSPENNAHPFMAAKFYKANFRAIPTLAEYDIVVWLDGTVRITDPDCARGCVELFERSGAPVITCAHPLRGGRLGDEVSASQFARYTSAEWNGCAQPVQDIDAQFAEYMRRGYQDHWWEETGCEARSPHYGVFVTCFAAFDLRHPRSAPFLESWWRHILEFTTQDQVSFAYACFEQGVLPCAIPDGKRVTGDFNANSWFEKMGHGV